MTLRSGFRSAPRRSVCLVLVALAAGCTPSRSRAPERGAGSPAAPGAWRPLFDGTSLAGWHGYGGASVPPQWSATEGELVKRVVTDESEGRDLVAPGEWGDFELELEWAISPCGNSGVLYRGTEALGAAWESAPEMQILDDTCHPDGRVPSHTAGSAYDLYTPTGALARPAGEWNAVRIVARGPRVEHWLNGARVVAYDQSTPDWAARVGASKFRDLGTFGTLRRGVIVLQDHGDAVRFRNLRIRPL